MPAKEIFENHFKELTQFERDCYTTSDQYFFEGCNFETVEDYKNFCSELEGVVNE